MKNEAEIKRLRKWIKEHLEDECTGCDYFRYSTRALSYECTHPEHGRWLEGDGCGCPHNTQINEVLNPHDTTNPITSCPRDTNGDGNCGRPLCPVCGIDARTDSPAGDGAEKEVVG